MVRQTVIPHSHNLPAVIAITLGDPGGIGMEIALKAGQALSAEKKLRLVFVGNAKLLAAQAKKLKIKPPPELSDSQLAATLAHRDRLPKAAVWNPLKEDRESITWKPGQTNAQHGRLAAAWIEAAVRGCVNGLFDGMVTAPINKQSLANAGLPYPGHTEYLAALTHTRDFAMLLIGGGLRVALATRHIPLAQVPSTLTAKKIIATADLVIRALPWLAPEKARTHGRAKWRLAVCALNPHAGDGGLLGDEENRIIRPALRKLAHSQIEVVGPLPADVVFHQAARGDFDAVIAMYHDQGLGPLKTLAFETGVNLTLGLPIVRTSPDHGTAFDIAGKNRADASSMKAAICLARQLAGRQNPWRLA